MKLQCILSVCFLILASNTILAQNNETTKPLELPAFIIEGVEQLNVKSGMKQTAARPLSLNAKELDSLNTYEKQDPALLMADKLPEHIIKNSYPKGFVKGSYGIFNTPEIDAAYQFNADRFDIFAQTGIEYSGGDAVNSEYNRFYLDVNSDYIAEDKFFIFGGSRTRTGFTLESQSYNFYGYDKRKNISDNFDRNLTRFKFNVVSDGTYENFLFRVGGNMNLMGINNDENTPQYKLSNNFSNQSLRGFLEIKNYWKHFLIGGNALVEFENLDDNSINFFQFDGTASYFNDKISFLARAGFQVASNSDEIDRGGVLLLANLEYRLNKIFTIKAGASSGLEKQYFEELALYNPYISNRTLFDYSYNILKIDGNIWYHPTEKIIATAGLNWRLADRLMYFTKDTLAMFKFNYADGTILDIFSEIFWNISDIDRVTAKLNLNISSLNDDKNLTYTPNIQLATSYYRKWFNLFGTNIEVEYTGDRYILADKDDKLDGYILLNFKSDYQLDNFTFELILNNITNSNVYIWNNYKERGFFASLGVMWQF